jgi:hypothetical protein
MNKHHPFHPIIYVRGFAATHGEIEETVADPYMGFNVGSTKSRQVWDGKVRKFFFESPIVRLKDEIVWVRDSAGRLKRSDRRYDDVYVDGNDLTAPDPQDPTKPLLPDIALPYQSIVIFRYYDEASEVFGKGDTPPIEHFAQGLSDLILRLRELVCRKGKDPITDDPLDNEVDPKEFRCYLVAHSMGGLVCRAFLQNPKLGDDAARQAVDKMFSYATPHNGIDLRIVRNVPGWVTFGDANNFNRSKMAGYLNIDVPKGASAEDLDVSVVSAGISPRRIFNLVGTNPADYLVMRGISAWAAGDSSDGLVRIENATTRGPTEPDGSFIRSPRAFTHRSHSGHYGIVNSEEGYQNLIRFFFGWLRVDGFLDIDDLTLPDEVQKAYDNKHQVRASYHFEIVATVRGVQWQIHRRTENENSAIHRTYDELFPEQKNGERKPNRERSPHLFSVFLDPNKTVDDDLPAKKRSVSFAFDLAVIVPVYEIDRVLWLDRHYEGGYIYRELILIEASPDPKAETGWHITYGYQSKTPNAAPETLATKNLPEEDGIQFQIPVVQEKRPGIKATLRLEARPWT